MLTRSKYMAASEAAGEENWEMERVSDTFHPPTTVVAVPDPTLAHRRISHIPVRLDVFFVKCQISTVFSETD